ncbi:hypothetical protein [Demequina sp.]|uniref:hypothetical protein n=1 Tax=Demequina sp. TaxID=2050685 RepID=UPI003A84239A
MTLHIDNPATEAAVRQLATRLGADEASVIDALVLDAYEALEAAGSYAERRNARVRLSILSDRINAARPAPIA